MRRAVLAALRGDAELLPKLTDSLRQRVEVDEQGAMGRLIQAAEALEPILADAVGKKPSRLSKLGLKSAHLLAGLAMDDGTSDSRLAAIAQNSIVGIVFVDIAGFTSFTDEHGDDAAIELLKTLNPLVEKAVAVGKGEIVKHLGDGSLLAFPSASQAVRAAMALRDSVGQARVSDAKGGLRLRIAVHAGEPLVEGDDLLGLDVNITARLLDHCEPDEVIVSRAAKDLAERRLRKVSFAGGRRVKLRGLATPVRVFTALPADDGAAGSPTG